MKDFKNKTALITGGNSGIGYATAKKLVERGAEVIITGRRKDAVEKAASELKVIGLLARTIQSSPFKLLIQTSNDGK